MSITRRYFLQSSGLLTAYCGLAPLSIFAEEKLQKVETKRNKTLLFIFLRGGMDGLNCIVPYGDPNYYQLRSSIAIPKPDQSNGALDLDGFFGLNPRLKALHPLFQSGQAAALHAVGYAQNTRSHFEEQDVWETGVLGNTIHADGWLNRHLMTSEGSGTIRAVAIGDNLPRILRGKAQAYAIRGLEDLTLPESKNDPEQIMNALEKAYQGQMTSEQKGEAQALLAQASKATLSGIRELRDVAKQKYEPKAPYPNNPFANRLKEVARLIKGNVGLEIAELDYGGWDTHQNQGAVEGQYGNLMQTLGDGLAAFCRDIEDQMEQVMVLVVSEFGRTAAQNGTNGTDHGWGNCVLALGGPVLKAHQKHKAPVLGKWPGLATEQLYQKRDLLHTTDFRDVFAEVVQVHLGNTNLQAIFPQHQVSEVGLMA